MQIDRANEASVKLDLHPVAERHQSALIEGLIKEQIPALRI